MLRNILVICFGLVCALIICEVGVRLTVPPSKQIEATVEAKKESTNPTKEDSAEGTIMPVMDWSGQHGVRLNPNMNVTIHGHPLSHEDVLLSTNSLGLRYRDLALEKGNEFRILNVGDSITLGDYVNESATIPYLLEKKLSEKNPHIAVINAGLPGASTFDEFYHYEEIASSVKPDIVLVAMYLNDAQNSEKFYAKKLSFPFSESRLLSFIAERLHYLDIKTSVVTEGIDPAWKETFRAGRALKSGYMLSDRDGFDFEIYNASEDFGLAWSQKAWENLTTITDTFARAVKENNQMFLVYLLPIHMQVYANDATLSIYPQEQFKKMCDTLHIRCFDTLPKLRTMAKNIPINEMYYDHCHYRKAGNDAVSQIVAEWVKEYVPGN